MVFKIIVFAFSTLLFHQLLLTKKIARNEPSPLLAANAGDINRELDNNLKKYYEFVNLASREIYKNDFFCASAFYDSAFLYKKLPFFVHLKNYLLVNAKCGFYDKNESPLRMLFAQKQVDTALLFAAIPRRVFNGKNLILIHKLQRELYGKPKQETALQKTMREIYETDQKTYDLISYTDKRAEKSLHRMRDSIHQENALRFIHTCEKYGFPTEETIGVFYSKNEEWSNVIYLLLRHFLNLKEREKIRSIIETALLRGNLHPSPYAALVEVVIANPNSTTRGENYLNTTVNLMDGAAYRPFVYYSDSLMNVVNTNRVSIGLDSFHVTQRQVVCQHFWKDQSAGDQIIPMVPYAQIELYTYGFVKAMFDQEGQDLNRYRINTEKILQACNCQEKVY